MVDIADEAGHFSLLGTPRQDSKCGKIRIEIILIFLGISQPVNVISIDDTLIIQRFHQTADRNGYIFQNAKHIRKLQPDKFYVFFFNHMKDLFLRVIFHTYCSPLLRDSGAAGHISL